MSGTFTFDIVRKTGRCSVESEISVCLSILMLGLVLACGTEFPESASLGGQSDALPTRQAADAQPRDTEGQPGRLVDATVPDAALFVSPDATVRDMAPGPSLMGRECTHEWPAVCQIDCDNEPHPTELLHITGGQSFVAGSEVQRYACALWPAH